MTLTDNHTADEEGFFVENSILLLLCYSSVSSIVWASLIQYSIENSPRRSVGFRVTFLPKLFYFAFFSKNTSGIY